MALVVFLRGVNVGGHRTFSPSALAKELKEFGVVNVGAAGTFVVAKPGARTKFRAELVRKLPFDAEIAICEGRDLARLEDENPFQGQQSKPDVVRFVSILTKAAKSPSPLPIVLPEKGEWGVKILSVEGQFVFGMYRRNMKAISYLSRIDKMFGAPATTRNWNTIMAVVRVLKGPGLKQA